MNIRPTTDLSAQELLQYDPPAEVPKKIGSSFFRGESCNFLPYEKDFFGSEFLPSFMKGWAPSEPLIDSSTAVTAFGSCFAKNIAAHLTKIGYRTAKDRSPEIYISRMGEGLVNVHSVYQQFEWALENKEPPQGLWHGYQAEEFGYDEHIRARTREAFLATDFFIITLGLSEVWYDAETGGIFWRAVPSEKYDPKRHKFRVCSFAETKETIAKIYDTIRKHVGAAKVLFTLSPVPLAATFRPVGCVTANSASKAIIRAALDEFIRERDSDLNRSLFYFPSYEIVNDLFFSRFGGDGRHPRDEIISFIMELFETYYCDSGKRLDEATELFQLTRKMTGEAAALSVGLPIKSQKSSRRKR